MDKRDMAVEQGKSRLSKKNIVIGLVGLVVLTGIALAIFFFTQPSKQDYKDVADALYSVQTTGVEYSYTLDSSRMALDIDLKASEIESLTAVMSQRLQRAQELMATGETTTADPGDVAIGSALAPEQEQKLKEIEESERATAKKFARNEAYLGEQIDKLRSGDVQKAYETYLAARQQAFGPGVDAVQANASYARTARISQVCEQLFLGTEVNLILRDDLPLYRDYFMGCSAAAAQSLEGDILILPHRKLVTAMKQASDERKALMEQGLSQGEAWNTSDYWDSYEALIERQEQELSIEPVGRIVSDAMHEALRSLQKLVSQKQQSALGSVRDR